MRFTVDHEFEVSLTLMGDSLSEPWRLLEIEVLVEDKETGDGKPLVHQMQVSGNVMFVGPFSSHQCLALGIFKNVRKIPTFIR